MATTTTMHMHGSTMMNMNGTMEMDMDDMTMTHMMQMTFYLSSSVTILFSEWATSTWAELLGSCIAVFVVAMLYEGLKVLREMALTKAIHKNRRKVSPSTVIEGSKEDILYVDNYNKASVTKTMFSAAHAIQALLHILQVTVSYLLMLIAMTYNGWLFIAIVTGAGTGYFLFSWKRAVVVDVNEHCH